VEGDKSLMQGSGPFNTIQEIKNYDAATQGSQRKVTFVEGAVVQDLFGFGPAEVTEYFLCTDQKYRNVCSDPYSRASRWTYYLPDYFRYNTGTRVYLDGALYKDNTTAWTQSVYVTTCYGDSSPVMSGPYRYHRVTTWFTQYVTLLSRGCTN
jgi:hypothetical protein